MEVEDLFGLEQLGTTATSPRGEWIAAVVARPRGLAERSQRYAAAGDVDHADVWLINRRDGSRRRLADGLASGTGYWNPVWSPDGKRLAILSTSYSSPARVSIEVWEAKTNALRRLDTPNADLGASAEGNLVTYGMVWSDSVTLLCPVEPEKAPPMGYRVLTLPRVKPQEASQAGPQSRPSVSVLRSGSLSTAQARPVGRLLAVNVVKGTSRVIAEGNFRQTLLSPSGRYLALVAETGRIGPRPERRIAYGSRFRELWRTSLLMLSLGGEPRPRWIKGVIDPMLTVADANPHSWSPDGSYLAVLAKESEDAARARRLFVVSAVSGDSRLASPADLTVVGSGWSGRGDVLALATNELAAGDKESDSTRTDWWALGSRSLDRPRKLTSELAMVPPRLFATPHPDVMVGLARGDIWGIELRHRRIRNLTDGFTPEILEQAWPAGIQGRAGFRNELVVRARDRTLYRLTWTGTDMRLSTLSVPSVGADLVEFRSGERLTLFAGARSTGTFLWEGDGHSDRFQERLAINRHVQDIADPKRTLIRYVGADGDSLTGLLLLPHGYSSNRRYPLVVWIYPGQAVSDTTSYSFLYGKQSVVFINLSLFLARGYGVLIPSVPVPPDGAEGDLYSEIPKGVLPAVDRAVEVGGVDPHRVGVIGHSLGGYSASSLISYTKRFKAAVAIAAPTNFLSLYGTFWATQRSDDYPHEELFQAALAESGQLLLNAPPWDDPWRYLLNSPVTWVNRIETPLMLIQGDLDYVPLQQGEELFTSLYRLGRTSTFVRYWGEGHSVETPANLRDMWHRIFQWFDEHMGAAVLQP